MNQPRRRSSSADGLWGHERGRSRVKRSNVNSRSRRNTNVAPDNQAQRGYEDRTTDDLASEMLHDDLKNLFATLRSGMTMEGGDQALRFFCAEVMHFVNKTQDALSCGPPPQVSLGRIGCPVMRCSSHDQTNNNKEEADCQQQQAQEVSWDSFLRDDKRRKRFDPKAVCSEERKEMFLNLFLDREPQKRCDSKTGCSEERASPRLYEYEKLDALIRLFDPHYHEDEDEDEVEDPQLGGQQIFGGGRSAASEHQQKVTTPRDTSMTVPAEGMGTMTSPGTVKASRTTHRKVGTPLHASSFDTNKQSAKEMAKIELVRTRTSWQSKDNKGKEWWSNTGIAESRNRRHSKIRTMGSFNNSTVSLESEGEGAAVLVKDSGEQQTADPIICGRKSTTTVNSSKKSLLLRNRLVRKLSMMSKGKSSE